MSYNVLKLTTRQKLLLLTSLGVTLTICNFLIFDSALIKKEVTKSKNKQSLGIAMDLKYLDHLIKFAHLQYREYLLNMLDIKPHHKIIDIGCGHGISTNKFAQMLEKTKGGEMVCIEGSSTMVNIARKDAMHLGIENKTTYIVNRVTSDFPIPFKDNYFDSSYSNRVLHNTNNPDYILREMIRVTKPGGKIISIGEDIDTVRVFHLGFITNAAVNTAVPYFSSHIAKSYKFIQNIQTIYKQNNLQHTEKLIVPIVSIQPYPEHQINNMIDQIPYLPSFILDYIKRSYIEKTHNAVEQGNYHDMVDMIIGYGTKPLGDVGSSIDTVV